MSIYFVSCSFLVWRALHQLSRPCLIPCNCSYGDAFHARRSSCFEPPIWTWFAVWLRTLVFIDGEERTMQVARRKETRENEIVLRAGNTFEATWLSVCPIICSLSARLIVYRLISRSGIVKVYRSLPDQHKNHELSVPFVFLFICQLESPGTEYDIFHHLFCTEKTKRFRSSFSARISRGVIFW